MGQYGRSINNIGTQINGVTKMSERLNNQFRAIGTTIRYAIAGQAVFGISRMVGQLRDVQTQMGLISAIGEKAGGGPFSGQDLNDIFQANVKGAQQAITPLKDYNDAVINFLSTVQNVKKEDISPMVTTIAQAAQLAQVSAEDATKAFTTMNVAFGKPTNIQNVRKTAQEFFILTREAPGGVAAGQQVIGQLGQLAQVTKLAGGTQEDMFSMLLSILRAGIPPSQAGRGLQFALQTVGLPGQQTKESRQALASVGITTTSNLTLQQRMARIFGHARRLGIHGNLGNLKNLDEDTLASMEAMPAGQGLAQVGITGPGAAFLGTVFRRIHALRAVLAVSGQLDVGQAQKDLLTMQEAARGHVSEVNDLSKAWQRFAKQAQLKQASVALNALGLQIAKEFEPVFNLAARGILRVTGAASRHPHATREIAFGGAAVLGALGIGRFLGMGRLPGLNRIPGLRSILGGGPGQQLVRGQAIMAAMSGNTALGGSPQNPMYVTVVGQLFNAGGGQGGGPGGLPPVAPVGSPSAISRLGKFLFKTPMMKYVGVAGLGKVLGGLSVAETAGLAGLASIPFWAAGDTRQGGPGTVLGRAQQLWGKNVTGIKGAREGEFKGRAEIFLSLEEKDPNTGKKVVKRVHIPVDMWKNGRAPTQKGKATARNK